MSDSTDSANASTCHPSRQSRVLLRPEVDRVLEILSHHNRRLVLRVLQENATTTEADVMSKAPRDESAIQLTLVHNHLPKLAKAGYIEWDRDSREISKGPQFTEVEPILELIEAHAGELPPDWP